MSNKAAAAALALVDAYRTNTQIPNLPDSSAPHSVEDAYAIQDAVATLRGPTLGWKVSNGAPPTCSPVFRIESSGATVNTLSFCNPKAEVEFGFRVIRDLPLRASPYNEEEVFSNLEFIPVIEIVASRYIDRKACSRFEILADGSNGALVIGYPIVDWRRIDFRTQKVELAINGTIVQTVVGTHKLENPATLVVWLANHTARRGVGLKSGAVVTTGGLKGATPAKEGDKAIGNWGELGHVEVRFC